MTNVDGAAKKILRESEADRQLRLSLVSIGAQRSFSCCASWGKALSDFMVNTQRGESDCDNDIFIDRAYDF